MHEIHWKTWDLKNAFQHYSNIHPMLKEEGKKKKKKNYHIHSQNYPTFYQKKNQCTFCIRKKLIPSSVKKKRTTPHSLLKKKKKKLPHIIFKKIKIKTHSKRQKNQLQLRGKKKKKNSSFIGSFLLFSNVVLWSLKLQIHNISLVSPLFFHPIYNGHYFFPHYLFHILNSSQ